MLTATEKVFLNTLAEYATERRADNPNIRKMAHLASYINGLLARHPNLLEDLRNER